MRKVIDNSEFWCLKFWYHYDPIESYWYAVDVVKGRCKELEPLIMTDPYTIYEYAKDVIEGRWIEAEPYILRGTQAAWLYTRNVLHTRWAEAETLIKGTIYQGFYEQRFACKL